MVNVVIPMAGEGSRFVAAGYVKPKPFIDVSGLPMIERVVRNLNFKNAKFILVARDEHLEAEFETVKRLTGEYNLRFVCVSGLTEGTACTVLCAREHFNDDQPLVIANSDQLIQFEANDFVHDCMEKELDGSILAFEDIDRDPKWSFAALNDQNLVTRVAEKSPISQYATVGVYLFRQGKTFVESAVDMMLAQDKVNGEYYTCPVYNYLIKRNGRVGIYEIARSSMHGLGTPDDLKRFLDADLETYF